MWNNMPKIAILRGDHRNEKVAYVLAEQVAKRLQSQGIDTELVTMGGLHSLIEILHDADRETIERFGSDRIITLYNLTLDETLLTHKERLNGRLLFDFHNTSERQINQMNIPPHMLPIANDYCRDGKYRVYRGDDVEWTGYRPSNCMFFNELGTHEIPEHSIQIPDRFVIETPAVYIPYPASLQQHYLRGAKKLKELKPDIEERWYDYLIRDYLSTYASVPLSREKGYLDEKVVSRLAALVNRLAIIHESSK